MDLEARRELLELYKLVHAEYRAEVALGMERQKLFLGFNPLCAAVLAVLTQQAPLAGRVGLLATALVSVAGVLVLWRSHARYRVVRDRMVGLEKALGVPGLDTTGGMRAARSEPRREKFKVVTVMMVLLSLFAVLELGAAFAL